MKKLATLTVVLICCLMLFSVSLFAQAGCSLLQANNTLTSISAPKMSYWSGLMELPFLLISVFFAFATANALKGGKFGKGMNLIAWGFVVMAVGHLHMQAEHFYGFNLFKILFGELGGTLAWFVALVVTWGFSGLGFYSMLKASKGQ
ncbi:MAG: hypothetical protein EOO02_15340 [Chitinophagaceae bacterium]|nr:MAG: hypothetical protein EOO02_15340 [Chitinophagaceae bacterium]